ncbi:unnamed protein product [Pseudo-nitzschia multistriata]|uniref:Uncharacterized protein n=1 Tax=Pseudo-nitzschia multistriata TaxID=183589 RepID=A0A448Z2L2_9STRA|nr:unnamed protein product [Pseudo-nitzschia multistriata]
MDKDRLWMPSSGLQKRREERTILSPHVFANYHSPTPTDSTVEKDGACIQDYGFQSSPHPSDSFEVSLHRLPRTLNSEIELVFPEIASQAKREKREQAKHKKDECTKENTKRNDHKREYLVIPTFHVTRFSILERNDRTEDERIRVFLRFRDFATEFKHRLSQKDPFSRLDIPDIDGASTFSDSVHTNSAYDEVASTRSILGYSTFLYMGIQIVQHPRIGYEKLAIHTIVAYANCRHAAETYLELLKKYQ